MCRVAWCVRGRVRIHSFRSRQCFIACSLSLALSPSRSLFLSVSPFVHSSVPRIIFCLSFPLFLIASAIAFFASLRKPFLMKFSCRIMSARSRNNAKGEKKAKIVFKCQDGGEVIVDDKATIEKLGWAAGKLAEDVSFWSFFKNW